MEKKLYKIEKGKMLDGVCGGIAEYFNIDPTLVRLGWALISLAGGSGVVAYIVCAIIIPRKPEDIVVE
jgi:phage shock protein C